MSEDKRVIEYVNAATNGWVPQQDITFIRGEDKRIRAIAFDEGGPGNTLTVDWAETEKTGHLVAEGSVGGRKCTLRLSGMLDAGTIFWSGQSSQVIVRKK